MTSPLRERQARAPAVILASASRTRAELLLRAGVPVRAAPAAIDETEVKRALKAEGADAAAAAEALAELKARRVSASFPGALVVGADQMLECDGAWFDKPADLEAARATLRALSGGSHSLVVSVVVLRDGARLWHHTDRAELMMRTLSDSFIESYLAAAGDEILNSVGCYRLEGLGAQLFRSIRGDHFTVMGLPLLPLLDFLRGQGVIAT